MSQEYIKPAEESLTFSYLSDICSRAPPELPVSFEPLSKASDLLVTEQQLLCRGFSALLRGTGAVVFKGGGRINHMCSLGGRSAYSASGPAPRPANVPY